MNISKNQLDKLIQSLEESKSYLTKKVDIEPSYINLISKIDSRIVFIKENKPAIKLVSTIPELVFNLKEKSEADIKLTSLYHFEAIAPFKNISKIVENCVAIFLIFNSSQIITKHQRKLIDLAIEKNLSISILVINNKLDSTFQSLAEYLRSQDNLNGERILFPVNAFFDLDDVRGFRSYRQFLIEQKTTLQNKYVRDNLKNALCEIESFFNRQITTNWRNIQTIKQDYLQEKELHYYQQQILNKTFNKIERQKQKKILRLKQIIDRSRSEYLNPFISNSWLFELEQIIERSQTKLVKEKNDTYIYSIVDNGDRIESIHNYILKLYQQKAIDTLESEWSKINYIYGDGGLEEFVIQTNQKIKSISIFNSIANIPEITFDVEPVPQLVLTEFIDPYCLQVSSKLVFDYNYTQSTWFKLLASGTIGIVIYLITKIYFGEGKYIGFFILFYQIINILTGQSAKKTKLKSHQKELKRTLNNKYQILTRLVVEQTIKTSIDNLERKNEQYQAQIDAIAEFAREQLDKIGQELKQHQSRKKHLKQDITKIKMLFNR